MNGLNKLEVLQQTRHLWKSCFGDSEAFMDIYFSKKFTPTSNITRQVGRQVVAAAQVFPYTLCLNGERVSAGYISGLATLPEHRGQGHAAQILHEAHRRLSDAGALFSFLIPGNEDLRSHYRKSRNGAYETVAYRRETTFNICKTTTEDIICTPMKENGSEMYDFYVQQLSEETAALLPSASDFSAAIEVCRWELGEIWLAHRNGKIVGWMMVVPEGENCQVVRDIRATDPATTAALLRQCSTAMSETTNVVWQQAVPSTTSQARPYAMARVVNVPLFLRTMGQKHLPSGTIIEVADDEAIPENNGRYVVAHGEYQRTQMPPDLILTPGELAAKALAKAALWFPMMLDE